MLFLLMKIVKRKFLSFFRSLSLHFSCDRIYSTQCSFDPGQSNFDRVRSRCTSLVCAHFPSPSLSVCTSSLAPLASAFRSSLSRLFIDAETSEFAMGMDGDCWQGCCLGLLSPRVLYVCVCVWLCVADPAVCAFPASVQGVWSTVCSESRRQTSTLQHM
jgi:hypothetical protein